ncbi:hypothetical protein A8V48_06170 [Yersinia pestis]|nr:hypothetical protein A8V21_03790 [Yersinia pestis]PVU15096.1 hypothetical protein A8V48_06170 [Yersinia pestis]
MLKSSAGSIQRGRGQSGDGLWGGFCRLVKGVKGFWGKSLREIVFNEMVNRATKKIGDNIPIPSPAKNHITKYLVAP